MKNADKIKKDMMELWKETFHDSARYIELVFDTYFCRENVFVRYCENRIIASLLCVPYEFMILTNEGQRMIRNGMYLCGLATHPDFRRRGIMSELMQEAERSICKRGFDLTFLIPADSHLRVYYQNKGYRTASFRLIEPLEYKRDYKNSHMNNYSIKNLFECGDLGLIKQLADWCREKEIQQDIPTLVHSQIDMIAVMIENENCFFMTEDAFDLKNPILEQVVAVVFPEIPGNQKEPIRVVGLYTKENIHFNKENNQLTQTIMKKLKEAICKIYPSYQVEFSLPYYSNRDNNCLQNRKGIVKPYAMIKNLKSSDVLMTNENLTFQISLMLD